MKIKLLWFREFVYSIYWLFFNMKVITKEMSTLSIAKLKASNLKYWNRKVIFYSGCLSGKNVFIKIYKHESTQDTNREFQVLSLIQELGYDNLVELIAVRHTPAGTIIVFEKIIGSTLTKDKFISSEKVAIELMRQTSILLDKLNDDKIIHCDIRPENIMVDSKGKLHLIDFEFAILKEEPKYSTFVNIAENRLISLGGDYSLYGLSWDDAYSFYKVYSEYCTGLDFEDSKTMEDLLLTIKHKIGRNTYEYR